MVAFAWSGALKCDQDILHPPPAQQHFMYGVGNGSSAGSYSLLVQSHGNRHGGLGLCSTMAGYWRRTKSVISGLLLVLVLVSTITVTTTVLGSVPSNLEIKHPSIHSSPFPYPSPATATATGSDNTPTSTHTHATASVVHVSNVLVVLGLSWFGCCVSVCERGLRI
jgi:hypothetical protein